MKVTIFSAIYVKIRLIFSINADKIPTKLTTILIIVAKIIMNLDNSLDFLKINVYTEIKFKIYNYFKLSTLLSSRDVIIMVIMISAMAMIISNNFLAKYLLQHLWSIF